MSLEADQVTPRRRCCGWLCGPRGYSGNCLIVIDDDREDLECEIPVWLCKGSKFVTLEQLWPKLKKWR